MHTIRAGDIIQSPHWPEPIEVNLVEEYGSYIRIVGRTISGHSVDQMLPLADLQTLRVLPPVHAMPFYVWKR